MKPLSVAAGLVGLALLALGVVYIVTPAGSLPSIIPGYEAGSSTIHYKHAIASLLLGAASLVLAWFQSGQKSSNKPQE